MKLFRILIEDATGKSYFYQDQLLQKNAIPTPLQNSPEDWQDIEFSFDTNSFYFGLFRSVSTTFKMTKDGAKMLRELTYGKGKGYATDLYIRIYQQDRIKLDTYYPCYYAKIDLTTMEDSPGLYVSINTMEGGIKSFLDANDGVTYDISCSDNSPQYIKIFFDGVTLFDKYNFSFINIDVSEYNSAAVPTVFLNNEGDSVGIVHGDQTFEQVSGNEYFQTSANYIFKSLVPTQVRVQGEAIFGVDDPSNAGNGTVFQALFIRTSDTTPEQYNLLPLDNYTIDQPYPFDVTIDLDANEKVFILTGTSDISSVATMRESRFSFSFSTKQAPTTAFALRSTWLGQAIVDKQSNQPGKYQFKSDFLSNEGNEIVISCGDALRNTDKISANAAIQDYYISTSFKDFFQSLSVLQMSIQVKGKELWMEPATSLYTGATTTVELGELSELKIKPIKDRLINSITTGYPDQNYDQRAGKWEVNSAQHWKAPNDVVNADLNIQSKYRADPYGAEFIRSNYTGKDTTDNAGDKTPWLFVIDNKSNIVSGAVVIAGGSSNITTVQMPDAILSRFFEGTVFKITNSNAGNNGNYIINSLVGNTATIMSLPFAAMRVINAESATLTIELDNYVVLREPYSSITGVPAADIYNLKWLTPKRRLLGYSAYLASLFYQQPSDQIIQTSAAKNNKLVTVLNGVTISESAPVTVGDLGAPLFLPYVASFKAPAVYAFQRVVQQFGTKIEYHGTYNGVDITFLSIGKMATKPATDEVQTWELYLSPKTPLWNLFRLSDDSIVINIGPNTLLMNKTSPIHWIKENYTPPVGVHSFGLHDDWVCNRFPLYVYKTGYTQKWVPSDPIKAFFLTNGVASLTLMVYDKDAKQVMAINFDTVNSTAVTSPNILKMAIIPPYALPVGTYLFAVTSGDNVVLVSEWQEILDDSQPFTGSRADATLLIEYTSSRNVLDTYFSDLGMLSFRVEGVMGRPVFKNGTVTFTDDLHDEVLLNAVPYIEQPVTFGDASGFIPDWMVEKINMVSGLDGFFVEKTQYTRASDAQLEETSYPGYPLTVQTITFLKAKNRYSEVITGVTGDDPMRLSTEIYLDQSWDDSNTNGNTISITVID